MTISTAALLFTVAAISLVIGISVTAQRRFGKDFFRHWIMAHVMELVTFALLAAGTAAGEVRSLLVLGTGAAMLSLWHIVQTGRLLEGRLLRPWTRWVTVACGWALGAAVFALGGSLVTLMGIGAGIAALPLAWLGWVIMRRPHGALGAHTAWLAAPMVMRAALSASYGPLQVTGLAWAGYAASGMLHLVAGMAMVMYLAVSTLDELEAKNAELQALDRLKTSFLGTVSHELRTPLTIAKGLATGLQDGMAGPLKPEQAAFVGQIETQADQLGRMVDDLITFSELEAGRAAYALEDRDLVPLLAEIVEDHQPVAAERGLTLYWHAPQALPSVSIDAPRLARAIRELVDNALKFTPDGGEVEAWLEAGPTEVRLHVRDSGDGIDPSWHRTIFERFRQLDGSTTRKAGGLGLGLAISRAIVEGHGGRLEVASRPGAGSTFTIALPAKSGR